MAKRDGPSDQYAGQSRKGSDVDGIAEPEDSLVYCEGPLPEPDIQLWARAPLWSIEDASFLAAGVDPMAKKVLPSSRNWPEDIKAKMNEVQFLIQSGLVAGEIRDRVTPAKFVDWCKLRHIDVPEPLLDAVRQFNRPQHQPIDGAPIDASTNEMSVGEAAKPNASGLGLRERESLLKLVIGMAVRGYKFDPRQKRNDATSDIFSDLDHLDIRLDRDTILKWLREGAKLLSPNALEKK